MVGLPDIARAKTPLAEHQIDHLQRLVAAWDLLADLCFADLLLYAPVDTGRVGHDDVADGGFVVLGQIRPATSQTLYLSDWMGTIIDPADRPIVARCYRRDEMIEGEITLETLRERVRVECIPVRVGGGIIGVLTRESASSFGRQPGELERTYVGVFHRFARMIADGTFPFPHADSASELAPRVGDGVVLLDAHRRLEYHSPNGVSALNRIGVTSAAEGRTLSEIGLDDEMVRNAFAFKVPVTQEVERPSGVTVVISCIPLLERGQTTGAVVLIRDISELRRRDLMLLSKDATIREIHHRVKNNLQTISSLLSLQARRMEQPEAQVAIEESVARIRSIALVHEILSRGAGEDVPFEEVLRPLLRTVEEGLVPHDYRIKFKVTGDAGKLTASIATPLAIVLTELVQNVVEHAYPVGEGAAEGTVEVALTNDGQHLIVTVADDGVGLPPGFDLDRTTGLGLSIVRTLITTELQGTIEMHPRRDGDGRGHGAVAEVRIPLVSDVG
jgi:two-component sensor histidine kinase